MNVKIVYAEILKNAWKGFISQCWILMGLLIGYTIIYSLQFIFNTALTIDKTISISGIVVSILFFILSCLFVLGYLKNCLQTLDREEPQFSAYGQASRKLFSYIAVYIPLTILLFIGCALLLFPGFYLALRLQFFVASMVDEDTGVIDSIKRSWDITKGHTMRLFVLMLIQILIFIIGVVAFGIGIFAAIPLIILMYGATYRKLTAPAT
jgi:uncharacterized membrane protein